MSAAKETILSLVFAMQLKIHEKKRRENFDFNLVKKFLTFVHVPFSKNLMADDWMHIHSNRFHSKPDIMKINERKTIKICFHSIFAANYKTKNKWLLHLESKTEIEKNETVP